MSLSRNLSRRGCFENLKRACSIGRLGQDETDGSKGESSGTGNDELVGSRNGRGGSGRTEK
jgi:hypothetical protein